MTQLYRQGVEKIEVIVRKGGDAVQIIEKQQGNETKSPETMGGGASSGGVSASETKGHNGGFLATLCGSDSEARQQRVIKTNATHTLAITKQTAGLAIEYWKSGIGYETGDMAYQDIVSRKMEVVEDTTNIASSIGMGALYGAWGGPIGSALGAIMGGVSTSVSTIYKYKNRERDYSYKIFKEENGIAYKRARAGINLTTGRLR